MEDSESIRESLLQHETNPDGEKLGAKLWIESKKLWQIAGPSIFSRISSFTMNVVTAAFAGHLGDLELASMTIANTVIIGFNFGLLLGMASALETLCGQAFGGKRPEMLGIYLQRSFIVLFLCCFLLLPMYIFAAPILRLIGESDSVADLSGTVAIWLIPLHFSFAFMFPLQRFLQSQLRTEIIAWVSFVVFLLHCLMSWLFVYVFGWGLPGLCAALNVSWWLLAVGQGGYVFLGWCPDTWKGFSMQAFAGLWEFVKLSASSGVMLCLENWYYRILVLMTGGLKNATIAVDALSICQTINGWEMMIPLAFFAATGVRVANELGAGNGEGAKFATKVAVGTSTVIGLFFCVVIVGLRDQIALIFTTSTDVIKAVDSLSWLLGVTILLNSVQPILSGVAVGSGWQAWVAYINIGCYYVIGLPLGMVLDWVFNTGVMGIWAGMLLGGTALQTAILSFIVARCNWDDQAEKAVKNVEKWSN